MVRASALAVAFALLCAWAAGCGGSSHARAGVPPPSVALPSGDPLAYSPGREDDYVRRATAGLAHVLYAKSPGGIQASVARTEHWRALISRAASAAGIDPDTLEGLVLLESAGRADAIAGGDVTGAAGLTQIVASTGVSLLGMHIDLAASRRLTHSLAVALARHQLRRAARLAAARRRADPRFDPASALTATARYLRLALSRFGRQDLAIESYHMGIGNLQTALGLYGSGGGSHPSYARLYFDSTPLTHPAAWRWLSSLGDDSATYLWRVYAARQIVQLARTDPAAVAREAQLQLAAPSAEEVLHPPGATTVFASSSAAQSGEGARRLAPLPARPLAADGIALDPLLGRSDAPTGSTVSQYRALAPGALELLGYVGARVQRIAAVHPLTLAAAAGGSPLDQSGWTFDISRRYVNRAQAEALQFELDRLTALNLIAWVRQLTTIHVTVAGDAGSMLSG